VTGGFHEIDLRRVESYRPVDSSRKRDEIRRDNTNIVLYSKLKNFLECVDRVLATNWVALKISNVIVCCNQYPYDILLVWLNAVSE
jgi:hypothetical protein